MCLRVTGPLRAIKCPSSKPVSQWYPLRLLASYATNAALSASETTLQSALDAILAELAALQLSGSGGVVNAPAWAGFTTWELVRGSNVVRNLHFVAPLSAALANGDDTLSITADCYSTAGTDAAIAAALLAYYTSSQVDTLLGDYRTGTAQDAETTSAIVKRRQGDVPWDAVHRTLKL